MSLDPLATGDRLAALLEAILTLQADRDGLQGERDALWRQNHALSAEITTLRSERDDLAVGRNRDASRADTAEATLAEREARLREVTAEWESCLERDRAHWPAMQDMQRLYQQAKAEIARLVAEVAEAKTMLTKWAAEPDANAVEVVELRATNARLAARLAGADALWGEALNRKEAKLKEMEGFRDAAVEELASVAKDVFALEADRRRLREALRQARAFIGDDFDPQDGYDASLAAHLDAALAATPLDEPKERSIIEQLQAETTRLRAERDDFETQCIALENDQPVAKYRRERARAEQAEAALLEARTHLTAAQTDVAGLRSDNAVLLAHFEQAERERDHWQTRHADLTKDCQRYRADLDLHRAAQDAAFAVFDRLDDDGGTMAELAGRAIDRAEQAEAENQRLQHAVVAMSEAEVTVVEELKAENARLRAALEEVREFAGLSDTTAGADIRDAIDAALVPNPKKRGTPEGLCTACSATGYCAEHAPPETDRQAVEPRCTWCGARERSHTDIRDGVRGHEIRDPENRMPGMNGVWHAFTTEPLSVLRDEDPPP